MITCIVAYYIVLIQYTSEIVVEVDDMPMYAPFFTDCHESSERHPGGELHFTNKG